MGKIHVIIDQLGDAKVEADGFVGTTCADATKAIQQALAQGAGGVTTIFKPSWNETEDEVVNHEVHGGW